MRKIGLLVAILLAFGLVASTAQAALFSDNFNSYAAGTELKTTSAWGGVAGAGTIRNWAGMDPAGTRIVKYDNAADGKFNITVDGDGNTNVWTDYIVSADFRVPSTNPAHAVGLKFRATPSPKYSYLAWLSTDGSEAQIMMYDGTWDAHQMIYQIGNPAGGLKNVQDGLTHNLKVVVTGGNAQIYLDNVWVLGTEAYTETIGILTDYTQGRAGMQSGAAVGTNSTGISYFDNFEVAIPEPASLMLLGTGLLGLIAAVRKKTG